MNKNKLVGGLIFTILLTILTACSPGASESEPLVLAELPLGGPIAEGSLEPGRSAQLSFGISGLVEEVIVKEGTAVKTGDVIARLASSSAIEAEIKSAELEYLQVQQALTDLDLYAAVERGSALQSLIDAREAFHIAQEDWDEFEVDEYEDDLGDAQEDIQDAQDDLEDALADLEEYLNLDEDNRTRKRYQDEVDDMQRDLHQAEQDYSEIENEYLQAKLDYDLAVGQLAAAQAEYDRRQEGPDSDQQALLQAQSAALEQTISGLQGKLASSQIISPIDGVVFKVDLNQNEFAPAGMPLVMVADTSSWTVKTDDVSEFDVVEIQPGQDVHIQVDALPEISLQGKVQSIDRVAVLDQGDVTYPVTITINAGADGLRWGMTVSVNFQPMEK
jgi:multidrug efflux pump subunit AcrA (membrane-fusion protein)